MIFQQAQNTKQLFSAGVRQAVVVPIRAAKSSTPGAPYGFPKFADDPMILGFVSPAPLSVRAADIEIKINGQPIPVQGVGPVVAIFHTPRTPKPQGIAVVECEID
jgi:hypothetical protein